MDAAPDAAPATPAPPTQPSEPANASATPAPPPDAVPGVDPKLRAALAKYFNDNQHPAESWQDLLSGRYLTKIPTGPDGKPLDWKKAMAELAKAAGPRRE
ncbi:MAG: hypothetical protein HY300_08345 [Verrucomicrobia bacterium]|nr:hypothetical protein [Verrucomicrobiota bacterium]